MKSALFFLFFSFYFFINTATSQTFRPEMDDTSDTSKITTTIIYYNVAWIDSLGVEHVDFPSAESTDYWAVKSMLDIYQKADPKNYYFVKIRLKEIEKKE